MEMGNSVPKVNNGSYPFPPSTGEDGDVVPIRTPATIQPSNMCAVSRLSYRTSVSIGLELKREKQTWASPGGL